jgi:type VI secretion system protein ImpH
MAPESRPKTDPVVQSAVEQQLRSEPWTFDFFQAMRLLMLLQSDRRTVGEFWPPRSEAVRLGAHPSLSFPASQIQELTWHDGEQPFLRVNFMGLVGALGVLPAPYTELVLERRRLRDTALGDFLDIFHHRIASLFYKAWEKSHFTIGYERQGSDSLTDSLFALVGLGTAGLRDRQPVLDETFIFYSGLYGMATRPAVALEAILAGYFDVRVTVEQFVGVWRRLDENDWSILETGSPENCHLGSGAVLGDEVWDQQSRARIQIGPLPVERYQEFLPDGSAYQPLRALTKAFCGDEIEFEVQLILERQDVPACELGRVGLDGSRLGWLTWLKSGPELDRDPGDTILLMT